MSVVLRGTCGLQAAIFHARITAAARNISMTRERDCRNVVHRFHVCSSHFLVVRRLHYVAVRIMLGSCADRISTTSLVVYARTTKKQRRMIPSIIMYKNIRHVAPLNRYRVRGIYGEDIAWCLPKNKNESRLSGVGGA